MKTLIVDEGLFTLFPHYLQFQANGRGTAHGLPVQMAIPFGEILLVETQPYSPNDGGLMTFTLLKENFKFSVNYSKANRVQANQFVNSIKKAKLAPITFSEPPNFSGVGRPKTQSEKNALTILYIFGGGFILLMVMVMATLPKSSNSTPNTRVSIAPPTTVPTKKPVPRPTETPKQRSVRLEAERAEKQRLAEIQNAERVRQEQEDERLAQEQFKRDHPLELIEGSLDMDTTEYTRYITGKIRNNTEETYGYVQVTFGLYDSENNQIGSTLDNVNGLEPGGTWKFKAIVMEDNAKSYKMLSVDGS